MTLLQTKDLIKLYGSGPNLIKALDGITLSIENGEFVSVVGTSGSGKSTHDQETGFSAVHYRYSHRPCNRVFAWCRPSAAGGERVGLQRAGKRFGKPVHIPGRRRLLADYRKLKLPQAGKNRSQSLSRGGGALYRDQ